MLRRKQYQIIYADPPWQFGDTLGKEGTKTWYDKLALDDLMNLPVSRIAADDCLLAMWWVAAMPIAALRLMNAWGFKLITMKGFTYHKLTKNGKDFFGLGRFTRQNTEDCLFARKGNPRPINKGVRQFIECQYCGHSVKPSEARERLVELMGDVPRIELFARGLIPPGWDKWGNEVECTIDLWRMLNEIVQRQTRDDLF